MWKRDSGLHQTAKGFHSTKKVKSSHRRHWEHCIYLQKAVFKVERTEWCRGHTGTQSMAELMYLKDGKGLHKGIILKLSFRRQMHVHQVGERVE